MVAEEVHVHDYPNTKQTRSQEDLEDEGEHAQHGHKPFSITILRVLNIQRLCIGLNHPRLKFILTVTIQTKVNTISYEVPLATHPLTCNCHDIVQ